MNDSKNLVEISTDSSVEPITSKSIRLAPREKTEEYFERVRPTLMEEVISRFFEGDKTCTEAICKILTAPYLQKAKMTAIDAKTGKALSFESDMAGLMDLVTGKTKADKAFGGIR